jgi:hypothetical protein
MMLRIAIGAAAGLVMLFVGAPSSPMPEARSGEVAASLDMAEWSAARKRRYVRRTARPAYAYRAPARFGGADPAFGPSGRLYRRPTWGGSCVIDDGYGRFSACSNR